MNPESSADENARNTGLAALEATRRTLDALEAAVSHHRWNEAARLFALVREQAALGEQGSKQLAAIKLQSN